ncbi:phospholipase D family protein [Salmonella enterica]|nr:phospholipase D family protein [Salmonella enterica]ECW4000402.1 phospholipase D family protein [Salmonella enterica]
MMKKLPGFTQDYLLSKATTLPDKTRLERAVEPLCARHPGECGILALDNSLDAFAARYRLTEMAARTLDVQYYIWEDDMSGRLLFSVLLSAAKRGVHVRLLLDDNNTPGLDDTLRLLDSHPNIEVRLFNPFSFRTLRALGYLTDFARLNRRMHNKSYTADGVVTLVGGRNIGDAYFGAGEEPLFSDLDVMATGPVVNDVANDFERYWRCSSVSTLQQVLSLSEQELTQRIELPESWYNDEITRRYLHKLETSQFMADLDRGTLPLIWAKTRLLSDDPSKGEGKAQRHSLLPQRLFDVMGSPTERIDIISAYFVPTRAGVAQLLNLVRKGVKIAILTNSLAANDVAVVHAGYARWRKKLLRYGVELYELKPTREHETAVHDRGLTGNSGSSLHAKTFSIDGSKVFIGSLNFDPRSTLLNTEMGFVIESETLATLIHKRFTQSQRDAAWQLRLDRWGRINWIDRQQEEEKVLKKEPATRFWQRVLVRLAAILPVEWLL